MINVLELIVVNDSGYSNASKYLVFNNIFMCINSALKMYFHNTII